MRYLARRYKPERSSKKLLTVADFVRFHSEEVIVPF